MHDPVRFGFIGFGRMAKDYHYPSLHKNPRARIAAAADTRPRILDAARKMGIPAVYGDGEEMLKKEELDAVLIASRRWMGDRQMDALVQMLLGQSREGEPSPLAEGPWQWSWAPTHFPSGPERVMKSNPHGLGGERPWFTSRDFW